MNKLVSSVIYSRGDITLSITSNVADIITKTPREILYAANNKRLYIRFTWTTVTYYLWIGKLTYDVSNDTLYADVYVDDIVQRTIV